MSKFDQILRDKLNGFDAGVPEGAWEQFSQKMNNAESFETKIKEKVEQFETGGADAAWLKFAKQLQPALTWKHYLVGGIAAVSVGIGAFYFFGGNIEPASTLPAEINPVKVENTKGVVADQIQSNQSKKSTSTVASTDNNTVNNAPEVVQNNTVVINDNGTIHHSNASNSTNNNTVNKVTNSNTTSSTNTNNTVTHNTTTTTTTNNHTEKTDLPKPQLTIADASVCEGNVVTCKATNLKSGINAEWYVNNVHVGDGAVLNYEATKSGNVEIELRYTSDDRSQHAAESKSITVLNGPEAEIGMEKTTEYAIPTYIFDAKTNAKNYVWNFGDGQVSSEQQPLHTYRKKGTYNAKLTVTGANGCQTVVSEKVNIDADYNLLAPNAFSPNGSGVNDMFIPEALKVMNDVRFTMNIYDRSGKLLFTTNRIDNPWDGSNMNTGAKCTTGSYVWRVELFNERGVKEEYLGTVTLLGN